MRWIDPALAHRVVVEEAPPVGHAHDYVDAFAARRRPGDDRRPEDLLRAALDGGPRVVLRIVDAAWWALRFERDDAPGAIRGARVVRSTAQVCELAVDGPHASARMVLRFGEDGNAVLTTFLRLRGGCVRRLWTLIGPVHRRVAVLLMDRTAAA